MRDTWTYRATARRATARRDSARRTLQGIEIDLRDAGVAGDTDLHDLDGYVLHATDGIVGPVEEHLDRDGEGYVIVDTAGRMWGNKRLLPAGVVTSIDHAVRRVDVAMSLEELRNAPCYDPGRRHADETWYRSMTDEYYETFLD